MMLASIFYLHVKVQLVKKSPAMQETPVPFLGGDDLLEKG